LKKIYPRGKGKGERGKGKGERETVEITQSFGANFGELEPTFFLIN